MNDLVKELNDFFNSLEGDWKLESIYPFVYRGFNGETTVGMEFSSLQSGKTDMLIWHKRVDSRIEIVGHLPVSTNDLIYHVKCLLGNRFFKKMTKTK